MSEQFMALVTDIGKKKMLNASVLGKKIELSSLAVGDGNGGYYEISEKQTQLKNKVWEGPLTKVFIGEQNQNEILIESYIPTDVGGFYIREAGLFDKDGDLIAIAKHPETFKPVGEFGAYKDITVRIILTLSNAANVILQVDPSIVVATQKDLQDLIINIPNMINLKDYQKKEEKGQANGYAPLGADKKVPTENLPVPAKGLQLGETEDTAYRGDRGKIAYDHSIKPHAPVNAYSKESMDNIIKTIVDGLLQLGETSITAYRGDKGKIAYNHAISKHADPNSYTNTEIDKMIEDNKLDFVYTEISINSEKNGQWSFLRLDNICVASFRCGGLSDKVDAVFPVGFRPVKSFEVSVPTRGSAENITIGNDGITKSTSAQVSAFSITYICA